MLGDMNEKDETIKKELIEERKQLDIEIKGLEKERIHDELTIAELYTKLLSLLNMRAKRLQLDEKIKIIERLA